MTHVLIVEDQRLMRETMESYIRRAEGYELSGSLEGAGRAKSFCLKNPVDLVLMDVCTENDESGFTATVELKAVRPEIKVVIVTSMLDSTYLNRAKEVGAEGFWYKDAPRSRADECYFRCNERQNGLSRQAAEGYGGHCR